MKTKILLGSIGVVTILILVSFTTVVSVQSTASDSLNESPLFRIRTQKAINQDSSKLLASGYLGKGRNTIQIPTPDDRTLLYQKVIDRIGRMDEASFNRLMAMVIHQKNHDPQMKNIKSQYMVAVLYQLKNKENYLPNLKIDCNNDSNRTSSTVGPLPAICQILIVLIWLYMVFCIFIFSFIFGDTCSGHTCMATCLLNSQ